MALKFRGSQIVDLSTVRIEEKRLVFDFACPRCGKTQRGAMNDRELTGGKMFACANTPVCGPDNMRFIVNGMLAANFFDLFRLASAGGRIEDVTADDIDWGAGWYFDHRAAPLAGTSRRPTLSPRMEES